MEVILLAVDVRQEAMDPLLRHFLSKLPLLQLFSQLPNSALVHLRPCRGRLLPSAHLHRDATLPRWPLQPGCDLRVGLVKGLLDGGFFFDESRGLRSRVENARNDDALHFAVPVAQSRPSLWVRAFATLKRFRRKLGHLSERPPLRLQRLEQSALVEVEDAVDAMPHQFQHGRSILLNEVPRHRIRHQSRPRQAKAGNVPRVSAPGPKELPMEHVGGEPRGIRRLLMQGLVEALDDAVEELGLPLLAKLVGAGDDVRGGSRAVVEGAVDVLVHEVVEALEIAGTQIAGLAHDDPLRHRS
eukprot:scaffold7342_cov269-Pinguiococcus_pyrenoidosus.AAC.3